MSTDNLAMLMNGDKIILPDFLIADLYKTSLVDISTITTDLPTLAAEASSKENEVAASPEKIKFFGENLKKITVVVNQGDTVYINEQDLAFLSNILKACQLNIADIAIVNTAEQEVTYVAIKEKLNAVQILLFDVEPSAIGLPFKIPFFQVQNFGGCTIMPAPALSLLNQDTHEGKLLKTKLWNSLKQVFAIK